MIRIAVCDDNALQRELMRDMLEMYIESSPYDFRVEAFASAEDLLEFVRKEHAFDIYLLDLIMPGINGMEAAATLRMMKDDGKIIFLTATLEYAVASYDVNAFYYMLKPVDKDKFFKVLSNAVDIILNSEEIVTVKSKGNIETRIKPSNLMYIELSNRVPRYCLADGRIIEGIMLRSSFKESLGSLLNDSRFAMCGVSLVVNLRYVDAVDSDSILLRDGTQLLPPKSAYTAFRKVWKSYS